MAPTSLNVVVRVANHPRVRDLRQQQINMRDRLVKDYGHDFMGTGDTDYDNRNGFEGVNRWTPVERKAWNKLCAHLHNVREELKARYESA